MSSAHAYHDLPARCSHSSGQPTRHPSIVYTPRPRWLLFPGPRRCCCYNRRRRCAAGHWMRGLTWAAPAAVLACAASTACGRLPPLGALRGRISCCCAGGRSARRCAHGAPVAACRYLASQPGAPAGTAPRAWWRHTAHPVIRPARQRTVCPPSASFHATAAPAAAATGAATSAPTGAHDVIA